MAEPNRTEQTGKAPPQAGPQASPPPGPVRHEEQPTQPAEEWGQRQATGEQKASGGRSSGPSPGEEARKAE